MNIALLHWWYHKIAEQKYLNYASAELLIVQVISADVSALPITWNVTLFTFRVLDAILLIPTSPTGNKEDNQNVIWMTESQESFLGAVSTSQPSQFESFRGGSDAGGGIDSAAFLQQVNDNDKYKNMIKTMTMTMTKMGGRNNAFLQQDNIKDKDRDRNKNKKDKDMMKTMRERHWQWQWCGWKNWLCHNNDDIYWCNPADIDDRWECNHRGFAWARQVEIKTDDWYKSKYWTQFYEGSQKWESDSPIKWSPS